MVSDYSDAGQEQWLARQGHRPDPRAAGGSPGPARWRSTARRYTAENVVLANGADPIIPPILREARGHLDQPRGDGHEGRPDAGCWCSAAGRSASSSRRPTRRLGGEVVLVERSERLLAREAAPLGEALGEVLGATASSSSSASARAPPGARARTTC